MNGSRHDTSPAQSDGMDIWQFSSDVSNRLLFWNSLNVAAGLLIGRGSRFWRALASQNVGWGAINIAIAVFGKRSSTKRQSTLSEPFSIAVQRRDTRRLRVLLAANGVLDLVYMAGGFRLARRSKHLARRGIGLGVLVQGLLLFVFDWRMLRRSFYIRLHDPRPNDLRVKAKQEPI